MSEQDYQRIGIAIGQNPIGFRTPCHRFLRGTGEIGGYRWGLDRKLSILGRELSSAEII